MASAGTEILGPTATTGVFAENIRAFKPFHNFLIGNTGIYIADHKIAFSHKLMARIELSMRRYCQVFDSRAASGNPFINTRPAIKVQIKMIKTERLTSGNPL